MISASDVKGGWHTGVGLPWVDQKGACLFDPIPYRYAVKFVVTVAFDALVLLLTVVGVMKCKGPSKLGQICEYYLVLADLFFAEILHQWLSKE